MAKHAKLAPSASSRWMNCPGSIKLSEKVPEPPSSSFADEGTAAHAVCEGLLTEGLLPKEVEVNGKAWEVNEDMEEHCLAYDSFVLKNKPKNAALFVEEKFNLSWLYPGVFGSNDACVYDPDKKHLHIIDFKYGMGIKVSPEWNSQLMIYALGAVEHLWKLKAKVSKKELVVRDIITNLTLTIFQPRIDAEEDGGARSWDISTEDLFFWGHNVFRPAAKATENENATLAVGDHCRFCPALAVCPEQAKNALTVAKTDFDNPILPTPDELTPDELLKVLEVSDIISNWTKSVKTYVHNCMENGETFPGFKLVKRKSNRKWINEEAALTALLGPLGSESYTQKVLSVAQAEKALKSRRISVEATMDHLWTKPDTGTTMAKDSDKRRAIDCGVDQDFDVEFEFLN